ncbi:MAG TPA: VWA domain-containing protein [Opitutaceae bacterium]|nr:VWA domain-containing protein [Opitutaceae bacterium]
MSRTAPTTTSGGIAADAALRWRLILGREAANLCPTPLAGDATAIDAALDALYRGGEGGADGKGRRGGLGASAPSVARWLGDIRTYFPAGVVQVMQKDALERLNLRQMLLEPEMLAAAEPDVHLVATLLSLSGVIPNRTKDTARQVVRRVVEDVERRLAEPLRQAVRGALARSVRNRRPRFREIDWHRTIRANLKNYQRERRTIVPETLIGHGRKRSSLKDVILCVDQSGSMAPSVVYSSIFGAVMASLPALTTKMVLFDTAVVDLTAELKDPVDLLFGAQLGGGTDIHKALTYCTGLVRRPHDTTLVLVSDLCEGGDNAAMLRRAAALVGAGVNVVCLLALSDQGVPIYDHNNAARIAALGAPVFACTPDHFPEMIASALNRQDLHLWAEQRGLKLERAADQLGG